MERRLRPLGVMILALLREDDMHPYEMMRLLRERREDRLVTIRNGTFYHQVAALERDGLIAEEGVERDGNRPERTTYRVTPEGVDAVRTWVRSRLPRTDRPEDFRVALAEAHNLDRDQVHALLTARLATQRAELIEYAAGLDGALARGVDRQYIIEAQRAIALLRADIDWTAALIADLSDPALRWGPPSESGKDDA